MKHNKGIQCSVNSYIASGVALVDGEAHQFTLEVQERDARKVRAYVADQMGCTASNVLVNFKLEKHKFSIDCTYDDLVNALNEMHIHYTEKAQSEEAK